MIPIDKMPELNWTDNTRYEINRVDFNELFAQSEERWQIDNILIVGLIYQSYTSPPWMWFALTKDVKFRDLIDFRRIKDYIPIGTQTAVAVDYPVAHRFAKFYGFENTGVNYDADGREYLIYRRT